MPIMSPAAARSFGWTLVCLCMCRMRAHPSCIITGGERFHISRRALERSEVTSPYLSVLLDPASSMADDRDEEGYWFIDRVRGYVCCCVTHTHTSPRWRPNVLAGAAWLCARGPVVLPVARAAGPS